MDRREKGREQKALQAAQLDRAIENELLERLKQVSENEIYNYPEQQYKKVLNREADMNDDAEAEVEDGDEEELEDEEEEDGEEAEYNVEYVEDLGASPPRVASLFLTTLPDIHPFSSVSHFLVFSGKR